MNHFGPAFSCSVLFFILQLQIELTFCQDEDFSQDVISNYEPSLAMVTGILGFMFLLAFILVLYTKFCSGVSTRLADQQIHPGITWSGSHFSGIDKRVVESLPFLRFSSLKGSREGLECAVCLSKFEDIEILRVLPVCRHAFHIQCIDQWLEDHSTCPLCRQKIVAEESTIFTDPSSLRFLWNQSDITENSNTELFVQREEQDQGSSRFSIGGSFRKIEVIKQDESLLHKSGENVAENHRITISEIVFNSRWSNVSSSDLEYLRSEMLHSNSSNRFSALDSASEKSTNSRTAENDEILKSKEMERKILLERKFVTPDFPSTSSDSNANRDSIKALRYVALGEKRSVSEITGVPRYVDLTVRNRTRHTSLLGNNVNNERVRQLWLRIVRKTVRRFADRDRRSQVAQSTTRPQGV